MHCIKIIYWRFNEKTMFFYENVNSIGEILDGAEQDMKEYSTIEKIEIFSVEADGFRVCEKQFYIKRIGEGADDVKRWYNLAFDPEK